MPPKVFKILDYVTDGVKSSRKYWDDVVRTARETSQTTPGLRVSMNSAQRKGYLDLQHAQSQYKYFQNPRLARHDFEQIAPLSEFQRYLPKGQVGDPFGAMKLLEGTTNPYLKSVHRELKSFYPIGKQLQLAPDEIKAQMGLRMRDLFNNMYRVNTPMIFKLGGKVDKFWPGGILKKGIKWVGKKVGMVEDMNGYIKEGSHFRIVDKSAIDDAIKSGLIKSTGDPNGIVHYFKNIPYPNRIVTKENFVIETPESVGSFVAGHGGIEYTGIPLEHAGATLLKTNGNIKNASISTSGSSYWKYSPFWDLWKSKKFMLGGIVAK